MEVYIDFRKRLEKFQEEMRKRGIDVLVGSRLNTITHLSGAFVPWRSAIVVPAQGELEDVQLVTLILDFARIAAESWLSNVVPYGPQGSLMEVCAQRIRDLGWSGGTVGYEDGASAYLPEGFITLEEYNTLKQYLPEAKLVNANSIIRDLTLIKEKEELALLRQAAAICDFAQEEVRDRLYVGMSEYDVAGIAEGVIREQGSKFAWTFTGGSEIASGYRTAYMLGGCTPATAKLVQRGEVVMVDLHAMYGLMLGDVAHNYIMGKPSDEVKAVMDAYVGTCYAVIEAMKPGVTLGEVARRVTEVVIKNGWEQWVLPGYGHGIGHFGHEWYPCVMELEMENNTAPSLVLTPGYVQEIAVVCNCPGVAGFRLERPLLITDTGNELLSKSPIEPTIIEVD